MTLVDFYEVKRRIGSSTLEIVRLKKSETGGGMMGDATPVEGEYSENHSRLGSTSMET